ncbi:unnamed protein product [Closterium sp. Naga37s-1]|nr:unnamed protein product [Closterium sp. Naga37s-1]
MLVLNIHSLCTPSKSSKLPSLLQPPPFLPLSPLSSPPIHPLLTPFFISPLSLPPYATCHPLTGYGELLKTGSGRPFRRLCRRPDGPSLRHQQEAEQVRRAESTKGVLLSEPRSVPRRHMRLQVGRQNADAVGPSLPNLLALDITGCPLLAGLRDCQPPPARLDHPPRAHAAAAGACGDGGGGEACKGDGVGAAGSAGGGHATCAGAATGNVQHSLSGLAVSCVADGLHGRSTAPCPHGCLVTRTHFLAPSARTPPPSSPPVVFSVSPSTVLSPPIHPPMPLTRSGGDIDTAGP